MFRVVISSANIQDVIFATASLRPILRGSQRSALSSASWHAMRAIADFIASGGEGTWPETHPLTKQFVKRSGKWRRRSDGDKMAYAGMAQFVRYLIEYNTARFGFGTFDARDVRKGRPLRFAPNLEKVGERMQVRSQLSTTSRMQRLLGATRRKRTSIPGQDFFPTRRGTVLEKLARPINAPMGRKIASMIPLEFEVSFHRAITKRLRKSNF